MSSIALIDGAMALPARYVSGIDSVAQSIDRRLHTILGTWPEAANVGLPWDRWVADPKRLTPAIFAAAIRVQLQLAPEVVQVTRCVASQSGGALTLSASALVTVDGQSGTVLVTTDPLVRVGAPSFLTVRGA